MSKKRFYNNKIKNSWKQFNSKIQEDIKFIDIALPCQSDNDLVKENFNKWKTKFNDEWINRTANISSGNSIMKESEYIQSYTPFTQCALLGTDPIINNAINKYANECVRQGGKILIDGIENLNLSNEIKEKLSKELDRLKFNKILEQSVKTALIYGGCLVYLDINVEDVKNLENPLYELASIAKFNKINSLKVIEPYLCGAAQVNTYNPLDKNYMEPEKWLISGSNALIHHSRFLKLSLFEVSNMIKPLYNYFGISLCQLMKDSVKRAYICNEALADLFLRFRSVIIKTDLIKNNIDEAVERSKSINAQTNNLGALLLTNTEEYIESITPLSGLDKIVAQMMENIAVSARIPAIKLFGLTPSGFNATGEFDMNSYYDEIRSIQNSILKPFIERLLRLLVLQLGYSEIYPKYEFNNLQTSSELEEANTLNITMDFLTKAIQNGVLTQEQAFEYLKNKEFIKDLEYDESAEENFDLINSQNNNGSFFQ